MLTKRTILTMSGFLLLSVSLGLVLGYMGGIVIKTMAKELLQNSKKVPKMELLKSQSQLLFKLVSGNCFLIHCAITRKRMVLQFALQETKHFMMLNCGGRIFKLVVLSGSTLQYYPWALIIINSNSPYLNLYL